MLKYMLFMMLCVVSFCGMAFAAEVEGPKKCGQCGMDRTVFARSRMLVTYADGTGAGVCSVHCAAGELKQHGDKKVASLKVADYRTLELIDAREAFWVTGGREPGVMSEVPTWAFTDRAGAEKFVADNGGGLTTFAAVMKVADSEVAGAPAGGHGHHGHHGAGGQLLFNPAFGDDIYHTHPAGMWMVNYKYMHMNMDGLRDSTHNVPVSDVIPVTGSKYGFMMTPTSMDMDMHMFMVMYGLTDRFTVMGMATYLDNSMEMLMNMGMGMGNTREPTMRTSGLGDTELRGIYKLCDRAVLSLGIGIPTGDINQTFTTMGMTLRAPYDMQLGSGTVDLKPALTYSDLSADARWNWGAQVSGVYHVDRNDNQYTLGDSVKVTGWLQRALGPAATWLRFAYSDTGRIHGRDPEIQKSLDPVMGAPSPDAVPANYGGSRFDGFVGTSLAWGPVSLGVEGGIPLYQDLNGLQLKNSWYLTAGIQAMF